jgi:L-fuconolactonase
LHNATYKENTLSVVPPPGGYLAGIRHPVLVETDAQWLARPEVLRGLAAVADAGLVYDIVCLPRQAGWAR